MINFQQRDDIINISFFNKEGKIEVQKLQLRPEMMYNYVEAPNGKFNSFENRKLVQKSIGNKGRLSKFRIMEILHKCWERSPECKQWHNLMPNIPKHSIDIETEVLSTAVPSEENPVEKIRTIAVSHKDLCKIYGSKELTARQCENVERKINEHIAEFTKGQRKFKFDHTYIESERYMIKEFITDLRRDASIVIGWNVLKFDWSYICGRYKRLGGDPKESSPTRTMFSFYIADKWKKKEGQLVTIPYHLPIVDYMGLYEKLDTSISPKESSTLDWVSFEALKVKKATFKGSFNSLYETNYEDFCFYNAVDAILVQLLDEKLKTFDTLQALAIAGRVQLHEGYFFSDILENLFVCEHLKRGQYFPDKRYLADYIKFKGAYVLEPAKGIDELVAGYDIEATYPSTIYAMNFGADSWLGTVAYEEDEEMTRTLLKNPQGQYFFPADLNQVRQMNKEKHLMNNAATPEGLQLATSEYNRLYKEVMATGKPFIFDDKTQTFAVTGAVFDKTKISVPKAVLIDNIKARLFHKKKVSELAYEINQLEHLRDSMLKSAAGAAK